MLTQTSELAIKTLLFLALEAKEEPLSPRQIAESLGCSPSYLAKTLGMLVRSGVLRSVKGARGGVLLAGRPEDITLLAIVESCQGLLIANYCQEISSGPDPVCAFHQAMRELHGVMVETLSKWNLRDLMKRPTAANFESSSAPMCKMAFQGCEKFFCREGDA